MRNPAFPGQTSDMSDIRKTKTCCKHPKSSFSRANIRYVRHLKNQKVLHTCENQLYLGKHPICQTSEKPKVLQTSEKQLFQGKHPICQTSEKLKSAANMRKAALPGQTSDISNIRKTKKCCNYPKTSFTMANIRYFKHPKNQKVLQTSKKQLFQDKHPICQTSEKPKNAAYMQKPALPGQTSDKSNIRKTKKVLQLSENQLYHGKHPICQTSEKPKRLQTSENLLFQGKHPIFQTSEKLKSAANMQKPALPGQTSDISNIRKTKKCCKHAKTSFSRANMRYVRHPNN